MSGSCLNLKSYTEAYSEQPVEFKLLLVEVGSDEIVWKTKQNMTGSTMTTVGTFQKAAQEATGNIK